MRSPGAADMASAEAAVTMGTGAAAPGNTGVAETTGVAIGAADENTGEATGVTAITVVASMAVAGMAATTTAAITTMATGMDRFSASALASAPTTSMTTTQAITAYAPVAGHRPSAASRSRRPAPMCDAFWNWAADHPRRLCAIICASILIGCAIPGGLVQ